MDLSLCALPVAHAALLPREITPRTDLLPRAITAHDSVSGSGSNGCATTLPVRLLQQNLHTPFRLFELFLALARELHTSSNNFIASSSESCGLSSLRTTSSSRASDRSKSGFFAGSTF
jgi:hypothetical protein